MKSPNIRSEFCRFCYVVMVVLKLVNIAKYN